MTAPEIVMWLVVAVVGVPAMRRNLTAAALVLAWLAGQGAYLITGNSLPLSVYFMADLGVIAAIYTKSIKRCGPKIYPSLKDQLRCLITDLTIWDRGVVAIFLLGCWPLYVLNVSDFSKWWLLFGLTIIQFLLAGAETAFSFRHDVKARARSDPDNGLALAGAFRSYG